jgi:hypothetical protein
LPPVGLRGGLPPPSPPRELVLVREPAEGATADITTIEVEKVKRPKVLRAKDVVEVID